MPIIPKSSHELNVISIKIIIQSVGDADQSLLLNSILKCKFF